MNGLIRVRRVGRAKLRRSSAAKDGHFSSWQMIVSPWFNELFDLEADPNELNDFANADRRTVAELKVLLEQLLWCSRS